MPNLKFADLVREQTETSGTGPLTLNGATPGHRRFADTMTTGDEFHYVISGITHENEWEIGLGSLNGDGHLVRSPFRSSGSGAACDFSEGLKLVSLTVASDWYNLAAGPATLGLSAVPGLDAALAGKAGTVHAHSASEIMQSATAKSYLEPAGTLLGKSSDGSGIALAAGSLVTRRVQSGPFVADNGNVRLQGGPAIFVDLSTEANENDGQGGMRYYNRHHAVTGGQLGGFVKVLRVGTGGSYELHLGNAMLATEHAQTRWLVDTLGAFRPNLDNAYSLGRGTSRISVVYAASGAISTSDERAKSDIGPMPDKWLDAWGEVDWCRFKFTGGKRWHIGLIAQRIRDSFAAKGIDALQIGLLCYDEWEAEGEQPAGDRWGLRYDECFALEAAWNRRELKRLAASIRPPKGKAT